MSEREHVVKDNQAKCVNGNSFSEEVFNALMRNDKIKNLQRRVKINNPKYEEEGKIIDISFKVDNPLVDKFSFVLELTTSVRADRVRGSSHSARIVKGCNPNSICLLVLQPEEKYSTYDNPEEEIKQSRKIIDRINNEKILTDIDIALTSDKIGNLVDKLYKFKARKIQKPSTMKKKIQKFL